MKILVFGASNSKNSINHQLAVYASTLIKNVEIIELDLNDFEVPIYSIDREDESGVPQKIKDFTQLISDTDGLIISLAEHNGAYTVAFKNIMDWSSRHEISFFKGKPMLLLSTSPGAYAAKNVLGLALDRFPKFNSNIIATFSLPSFQDNFHKETGIVDENLQNELKKSIISFEKSLK